ncbi:MAG: RdgB/HAM1 family non-canonical purine NTP pyrophosphatase [Anaerolineae bacterium]|nr:RdgB/HAM1 family non-canonical purine NTP pyrophosphatase [Anaerolineae bacterium]
MQNLLVASTNPGKLKEYREMLADLPITWLSLADVGLDKMEVEETGSTFTANALIKAQAYCAASALPTLADDSGLMVDALNGAPGIHSARYAPTAPERNAKLLKALEGVPPEQRIARFVAVIAIVTPDLITITAEGRVEGHIGMQPRGTHGFGYDPVFMVDTNRTMAELLPAEKHAISHRGRALAKLHPILRGMFG